MEDGLLIRSVLEGNANAYRFLVLRYQRPLFSYLRGFGLPEPRVEELAQEAFVRAYRALRDFDPARGAGFGTWLLAIARNLALDERARPARKVELGGAGEVEAALQVVDPRPDPESALAHAQRSARLRVALARVPEPFGSALSLAYLKDLSLEEIAEIEQCSVGTVKSRVSRGKQFLKSLLLKEARSW